MVIVLKKIHVLAEKAGQVTLVSYLSVAKAVLMVHAPVLILVNVMKDGLVTVVMRLDAILIVSMVDVLYQMFVLVVKDLREKTVLSLFVPKTVAPMAFAQDLITVPVL